MARLEWAHIEAFDSEARPRLRVESSARVDPATLRLAFQPHGSLLQLGYPNHLQRRLADLAAKGVMESNVAIITGASQGIGRATALRLAKEFSSSVLAARHGDALKEVAKAVPEGLIPLLLAVPAKAAQ